MIRTSIAKIAICIVILIGQYACGGGSLYGRSYGGATRNVEEVAIVVGNAMEKCVKEEKDGKVWTGVGAIMRKDIGALNCWDNTERHRRGLYADVVKGTSSGYELYEVLAHEPFEFECVTANRTASSPGAMYTFWESLVIKTEGLKGNTVYIVCPYVSIDEDSKRHEALGLYPLDVTINNYIVKEKHQSIDIRAIR